MKIKTEIIIETVIGVFLRLVLWGVVNTMIRSVGDAAQLADNDFLLFSADFLSLLAFVIFVYFIVKYIKRKRREMNQSDDCRAISENLDKRKYRKKIGICLAAMFGALVVLTIVGVFATKAHIDWMIESVDIARIIVPLVTLFAIYKIKKRSQ